MITYLLLASALIVSPPVPLGDPATWVLPEYLQSVTDSEGMTVFDLMIDTTGVPVSCVTTQASGIPPLDNAVCAALMKNGRFHPASDELGNSAPSVWSDNVHWKPHSYGKTHYTLPPADLTVDMPDGVASHKGIVIQTASVVSADSLPVLCKVSKPSNFDLLNAGACELVARSGKLRPVLDGEGKPVKGVRAISVMFLPQRR